jgi:hypothetical protein
MSSAVTLPAIVVVRLAAVSLTRTVASPVAASLSGLGIFHADAEVVVAAPLHAERVEVGLRRLDRGVCWPLRNATAIAARTAGSANRTRAVELWPVIAAPSWSLMPCCSRTASRSAGTCPRAGCGRLLDAEASCTPSAISSFSAKRFSASCQRRADQQLLGADQDRLVVAVHLVAELLLRGRQRVIDRAEPRRSCSSCCPCEEAARVAEQQQNVKTSSSIRSAARRPSRRRDVHERAQVVVDHHLPGEGDDRAERPELVGVAGVAQADVLQLPVGRRPS